MPQLIVVTAAQLKTYRERFERLLAQDEAEQARLQEAEQRRDTELNLRAAQPNLQIHREADEP